MRPLFHPKDMLSASYLKKSAAGSSSLEVALLYGLLLATVMLVAHIALLYNANLTVADAADAALEELTRNGGSADSANSVADFISRDAPVTNFKMEFWEATGSNTQTQVFVRVTAQSPEIIPGLPVAVSHTVSGVAEEFVTEQSRSL